MAGTANNATRATGSRCVALVGPFQSGKTTLLEAILARTGVIPRQGTIEAGNTVGDGSKEARHHRMSVELTVATTNFMGDSYTFLDCPGSVEFVHDMRACCRRSMRRWSCAKWTRKKWRSSSSSCVSWKTGKFPESYFSTSSIKSMPASMTYSRCCKRPRAPSSFYARFRPSPAISSLVSSISRSSAPSSTRARSVGNHRARRRRRRPQEDARFSMLETLADHDDELMEQLLEDIEPPRDKVFDDLNARIARRARVPGADGYGRARQRSVAAP